jgi:hypothetical protein
MTNYESVMLYLLFFALGWLVQATITGRAKRRAATAEQSNLDLLNVFYRHFTGRAVMPAKALHDARMRLGKSGKL